MRPETIAQIKVTETIKEGQTIFALTGVEQRRGDLMLPGGGGEDIFNRFVTRGGGYRDIARSNSPFTREIRPWSAR